MTIASAIEIPTNAGPAPVAAPASEADADAERREQCAVREAHELPPLDPARSPEAEHAVGGGADHRREQADHPGEPDRLTRAAEEHVDGRIALERWIELSRRDSEERRDERRGDRDGGKPPATR